jgi:hypothetical protein
MFLPFDFFKKMSLQLLLQALEVFRQYKITA